MKFNILKRGEYLKGRKFRYKLTDKNFNYIGDLIIKDKDLAMKMREEGYKNVLVKRDEGM